MTNRRRTGTAGLTAIAALAVTMCGNSADTLNPSAPTSAAGATATTTEGSATGGGSTGGGTTGGDALAAMYRNFSSAVQVSMDGTSVVLRSNDVPDHTSPYFGAGHAMYEAPHAGMQVNPHRISAQNVALRVPLAPRTTGPSDTPLGPIGMAVNGVVFFNQYAAGRMPLTSEILSFDRYNGHPAPSNMYHYHFEPVWITARGRTGLVGVLLDGFPVYGPDDVGGGLATGLDVCNGHEGPTPDFPGGVYHYHTTTSVPYISGCFRGSPGSVG
jgi:hypothetical protein